MRLMKTIAMAAVMAGVLASFAKSEVSSLLDALDAEADGAAVNVAKPAPAVAVEPAAEKQVQERPVAIEPVAEKLAAEEPAAEKPADVKATVKAGDAPKAKKQLTGRDAKISSESMAYDRKEGVIFFDKKVFVDDEQYQMHADRVYVFLSGTNDVKRLVALGNVALTNEFRSASCEKAVYVKAASKVVLYGGENGVATLKDESQKGGTITGSRITFWLDSEQVEVMSSDITVPGGAFKATDAKKMLGK